MNKAEDAGRAQKRIAELEQECDRLRAEVDRLRGWLAAIEGGDNPCTDESELRQMAYRAGTLGHEAP